MPFTNYPPILTSGGTDVQDYVWLTQMVKAIDEVTAAANNLLHPPTSSIWDGNAIGTLTSTTLTDSTKNWAVYRTDLGTVKRWTEWAFDPSPAYTSQPLAFDIVFLNLFDDPWNWQKMLRIPITDQNWIPGSPIVSNQIIFAPAIDTANYSLSYYTHYFIVRSGGPFVHDRVPEWPNDMTLEWATGIATTFTSINISASTRSWTDDQWKGKWVYFTAGGFRRSAQITGNDHDPHDGDIVIHFAAVPTVPDVGVIGILAESGKYWSPDHQPQVPDNELSSTKVVPKNAWVRFGEAQNDSFWSHHPTDSLGTMGFPATGFHLVNRDGIPADDLYFDMVQAQNGAMSIDIDLFTQAVSDFDPPDYCFTRPYHKTFRSWQRQLMALSQNFVPYRSDSYDGYDRAHINNMSLPVFFWQAQVNAGMGTTGSLVTGGVSASLTLSESIESSQLPIQGFLTLERETHWTPNSNGTLYTASTEKIETGATIMSNVPATWDGTNLYFNLPATDPGDVQQQKVFFSWGNTRQIPNQFRYMYSKECFIPDTTTYDGSPPPFPPAADPPTERNPGNWLTRPASTTLLNFEDHGRANPPMSTEEYGAEPFITGTFARYVGDNWDYPTTSIRTSQTPTWAPPYWDNFYEGKAYAQAGSRNLDLTNGTVTSGDGPLQFGDASQHWWGGVLIGGSGESTHSGNVSTFTSTTITDASHTGSSFWNGTTTGRWVGHWLMIWQPGATGGHATTGPLHMTKRPITAYNSSTFTLTFPAITGLASTYSYLDSTGAPQTGTTQYRIREPAYEKNHFAGVDCELTRKDTGAVLTGTVLYSEDDRIAVDAWTNTGGGTVIYTPVVGDGYSLKRASTGTVWKWDGSEWVKPTGSDTRSGSSVTFPDEQWTIPPSYRRRYGRVMNGDYIGQQFHTEIAKMRNALRMTQTNLSFTPDADTTTYPPSYNVVIWQSSDFYGEEYDVPAVISSSSAAGLPYCTSVDYATSFNGHRAYGYGQISLTPGITAPFLPTSNQRLRLPASGTFLTYAEIDPVAFDEPGFASDGYHFYAFEDNGDPVTFRKWKAYDSFGSSTNINHTSAKFGSLAQPIHTARDEGPDGSITDPSVGTPGEPGYQAHEDDTPYYTHGYAVRSATAILDYSAAMQFLGPAPI